VYVRRLCNTKLHGLHQAIATQKLVSTTATKDREPSESAAIQRGVFGDLGSNVMFHSARPFVLVRALCCLAPRMTGWSRKPSTNELDRHGSAKAGLKLLCYTTYADTAARASPPPPRYVCSATSKRTIWWSVFRNIPHNHFDHRNTTPNHQWIPPVSISRPVAMRRATDLVGIFLAAVALARAQTYDPVKDFCRRFSHDG
jgi:hypothetical protein